MARNERRGRKDILAEREGEEATLDISGLKQGATLLVIRRSVEQLVQSMIGMLKRASQPSRDVNRCPKMTDLLLCQL